METNINIGSSQAFRLQRAVLIYGTAEHRSGFATVHEVQRPSAESNPRLGPAALVTTEFVRELVKGLGRNTILEVLPDNVLARNEFVTAWWTPAAARTLFFHENTELAPITGKKFPTPALVFKIGSGGQLSVRALAESRRPERTTALFHASFWNVYLDGKVCHGSMRAPKEFSLASLSHWEKAFFGSNFSHTIRDEVCLHPAGSTGLWKELAGAFGTFPVGFLKPSGDTLEEFVTHV